MLHHDIFLLFPSWCLSYLPWGGEKGHQKTRINLCRYMGGDWEALFKEHTTRTFTLTSRKRLELIPNPTPLPSTQLCLTQALIHVREYTWIVRALALNTHATPFDQTTRVFHLFHPLTKVDSPFHWWFPSWDGGYFKWEAFDFALACSSCLSFISPSGMVYELSWDYFVPDDSANSFHLFLKVCGHIVWGHIPPLISFFFLHLDF